MNAETLKRVIRTIGQGSQEDLARIATTIIEAERRSGHPRLADQLEAILRQVRSRPRTPAAEPGVAHKLAKLPLNRRQNEQLTTLHEPQTLEHHMVLPPETEERFARILSEYAARDRLGVFGLKPRRTILLYGPPGCGKSLGAKRLAWSTGLPLMKVRFDTLLSSYFGESAANLRSIFLAAKETPCVLLLDECDFIAKSRTHTRDVGEASRVVNALLQLMEEYDAPGLLVATTNIEDSLDTALFRRFDDVFFVPLPGKEEVDRLLRLSLAGVRLAQPIHWTQLVERLVGSSAALIVRAAKDAAKAAVLTGADVVTQMDLQRAIGELQRNRR